MAYYTEVLHRVLHNGGIYDAIDYKMGDTKKLINLVSNA